MGLLQSVSVSTVPQLPDGSFQLLPPSLWGDTWLRPSFQDTSGRAAPVPGGCPGASASHDLSPPTLLFGLTLLAFYLWSL